MRAGAALQALTARFAVHLLVVPLAGPATAEARFARRHAASVTVLPLGADPLRADSDPARAAARLIAWPDPLLCRFAEPLRGRVAGHAAAVAPQLVHVMRLYLVPYADAALAAAPVPAVLDLDDDEVRARERLATLYARAGDTFAAALEAREAERFRALEARAAPRFTRVLVASAADVARLAPRLGAGRVALLPNGVRLPRSVTRPGGTTLLFVGTLGYAPNEEAALWLIAQVLPRLRAEMGEAVRLRIVGTGAGPRLRQAAGMPGVELVGPVADLAPEYARAALVAVPPRAGGGTRIKLLEALAHGRPVVATTIGAEGVAVEHERHVLIADDPAGFATACVALLRDPERAGRLAAAGRALVARRYARGALGRALAAGHEALYRRCAEITAGGNE